MNVAAHPQAPIVVLGLSGKLFSMAYATYRDQEAAIQCAAASARLAAPRPLAACC